MTGHAALPRISFQRGLRIHPFLQGKSRGRTSWTGTSLGWLLAAGMCLPTQPVPSPGQAALPQHLRPSPSVGGWVSPAHAATRSGGSGLPWGLARGHAAAWAAHPHRLGTGTTAGWAGQGGRGSRTLLGVSRAAVFTFHLLEGTTGDFSFFLLFHFIFLRLCVSFTSQKLSCKHPAASPGGDNVVMEEASRLPLCRAAPLAHPPTIGPGSTGGC